MSNSAPAGPLGKGKGMPPPKGLGKGPPMKGVPPLPKGIAGKGSGKERASSRDPLGPKLRPLFWTVVNQVPEHSVFADMVDAAPFDKAQLERQFALADSRVPASLKAADSVPGSRNNSEEPRKRLRVLDDRTSQLLAIAFNRLPPAERVAEMLDTLDGFPDDLTSEAVVAMHNAVSEHKDAVEQIRQVATSQDAIASLDMPERFLLRLGGVPHCSAKLACGALIVGAAKELADLRRSGERVGVCCQNLRKSALLKKCISTSLAVGNFMNRGTARSGVRGVALPESLLKLEELRGGSPSDFIDVSERDKLGGSLLDFVVQALVNEDRANDVEMQKEAHALLAQARAASSVSLEETEANCRQVNEEATRVQRSIKEVPSSPGVCRMISRVDAVCEEAALAKRIAANAKEQLNRTQAWSCCKTKVKSDDWFSSWAQFLELLCRTLTRAQEGKARRLAQEEARRQEADKHEEKARKDAELIRPPLAAVNPGAQSVEDEKKRRMRELRSTVQCALAPQSKVANVEDDKKPVAVEPTRSKPKAMQDDDARIDNIDWSKINQLRQEKQPDPIKPTTAAEQFDDKENSLMPSWK